MLRMFLHLTAIDSADNSRIQEGMIFVSMTSDELLARTAQYHIQYSSARRRRRNRQSGMQPSQEYLNAFRSPLQSLERTVLIGPDSSAPDFDLSRSGSDPQTEFRVTTEYDESEDKSFVEPEDDDVTPSIAERRLQRDDSMERDLRRLQPDSLERNLAFSTTEESESDDDDHTFTRGHEFHRRHERELHRRVGSLRRQFSAEERELQRRRQAPSFIDPIPPPPAPSGDTHRSSSSSTEVLKPHARFFIEREKSMVSIKFDPPPYVFLLSDLPFQNTNVYQFGPLHLNQTVESPQRRQHRYPEYHCAWLRWPAILSGGQF